jgi:hypothetical protein
MISHFGIFSLFVVAIAQAERRGSAATTTHQSYSFQERALFGSCTSSEDCILGPSSTMLFGAPLIEEVLPVVKHDEKKKKKKTQQKKAGFGKQPAFTRRK